MVKKKEFLILAYKKTLYLVSFCYVNIGDIMKIYIDIILLINFFFDFILLLSVSLVHKIKTNMKRVILGAVFGSISIISLFFPFSNISLLVFKILISLIMVLISYKYSNIKEFFNNVCCLYLNSIILGGFLYFINNQFSYKNVGMVFYHNGFSINIILILILSPIIIYLYIKRQVSYKNDYSNKYLVEITLLNNKKMEIIGLLDSGNNLYDPYSNKPIIIIENTLLKNYHPRYLYVPCITINNSSLIRCFKIKKLVINNKIIHKDVLVGISDNNFKLPGVECLLHEKIMEEIL